MREKSRRDVDALHKSSKLIYDIETQLKELKIKIKEIERFFNSDGTWISNTNKEDIGDDEDIIFLLSRQANVMDEYSCILTKRLEHANKHHGWWLK